MSIPVVGVWTPEAWTTEDNASSDVDAPNSDYKRTNNVYDVGFAFHPICVLNPNRLWALCLPESVPFICATHILISKQKNVFDPQPHPLYHQTHTLTAKLVNMAKGC